MKKSRLDETIMELEGMERLKRADIEAMQLKKLNVLLGREKKRGGFYGSLPEKLDSLEELASLPFTEEADLQAYGHRMLLCSQNEIQRVITDRTSGTTGLPKRIFYTKNDLEHTVRLFMAGLGEFIFPGNKTMICMPFSGPFGLGELIAEAVERLGAKALKTGPFLTFSQFEKVLKEEKPDTFVGMAVQLLSILRYCGKGSLERALVSGDACPDTVLEQCEMLLGTKLFPHYGSREIALGGAVTCPAHQGMHLRENHIIAEIIDEQGNVLPHGEYGELVITTIGMEAQPLIRYRTGDRTRILAGKCPCESELIRIDQIKRINKSGLPDMEGLDNLVFSIPEVIDYQAEYRNGILKLYVLSSDKTASEKIRLLIAGKYHELQIEITEVSPSEDSRPLYPAKRILTIFTEGNPGGPQPSLSKGETGFVNHQQTGLQPE